MKRQSTLLRLLFCGIIFSILLATGNYQVTTQTELKNNLFKKTTDISGLSIYAGPPTMYFEDFKNDKFSLQIDSIEIEKNKKWRNELEPIIIQHIDNGMNLLFLKSKTGY